MKAKGMMSKCLLSALRKRREDEDGNATIEFVIFMPLFMFLFIVMFEAGYFMVRGIMLERGVDIAVREVRLSNGAVPDYPTLKKTICDEALILPNCERNVQIQMEQVPIAPGGVANFKAPANCVDVTSTDDPASSTNFDTGSQNQLMIVRVCALMQPLFPTSGIGAGMGVDSEGNYAIVRTAAFVTEPGSRTVFDSTASGSGGASTGSGS